MKDSNREALVSLVKQLEATRGQDVALVEAARWSLMEEVDRLLDAGVSPNVRLEKGATPLMCAGTKRSAERLLEAGADPNATDDEGCTPLIWICKGLYRKRDAISRLSLLLKYGADPAAIDRLGQTAADYARPKYDEDVLALLT